MRKTVKIKVYGDSRPEVLRVVDEVRKLYAPNVTQSDLRESDHGGCHAFLTVYREAS